MSHYSVDEIIRIARVSGYLTANDAAKGTLFGERVDPDWHLRLYLERRAVEWMQGMDSAYEGLTAKALYLFALCGGYGRRAAAILQAGGSGTVITPTAPSDAGVSTFVYRIPITGADFADSTRYNDTRIVGHSLGVYWNDINREVQLDAGEWTYTPTGIQILVDGFDAQTTHAAADLVIYINDPDIVTTTATVTSPSESSSGTAVAFSGDGTYALAAGSLLERVIILPGTDAAIKIGLSAGADDVLPETTIATTGEVVQINRFSLGGLTLYFTGVPAGSTIVFFTKQVNLS